VKITIYHPEPSEEEEDLCLRLERLADDRVSLDAVDPGTGERLRMGTILSIRPGGVLLHECLTPNAGLPLDDKGRVKLYESYKEE
jgi:hypothetical protein